MDVVDLLRHLLARVERLENMDHAGTHYMHMTKRDRVMSFVFNVQLSWGSREYHNGERPQTYRDICMEFFHLQDSKLQDKICNKLFERYHSYIAQLQEQYDGSAMSCYLADDVIGDLYAMMHDFRDRKLRVVLRMIAERMPDEHIGGMTYREIISDFLECIAYQKDKENILEYLELHKFFTSFIDKAYSERDAPYEDVLPKGHVADLMGVLKHECCEWD